MSQDPDPSSPQQSPHRSAAPISAALLGQYKRRLEGELAELRGDPGDASSAPNPDEAPARAEPLQSRARVAAIEVQHRGRIARIVAALHRIESGQFGICTTCGAAVTSTQLDSDATIARCATCRA